LLPKLQALRQYFSYTTPLFIGRQQQKHTHTHTDRDKHAQRTAPKQNASNAVLIVGGA